MSRSLIAVLIGLACTAAGASPFKDLHDFTASPDGREPAGSLTAVGSVLYGTTNVGGTSDSGTIYRIDPITGAESVVYSFTGAFNGETDASAPVGEMVESGGILYGTSSFGGQFNGGTVFSFDPATSTETVLYSFGSGTDGAMPGAGPTLLNSLLYGTTTQGGASGLGTVWILDLSVMTEKVLYSFAGGADGSTPFAPVLAQNGNLYGTTFFGGPSNDGTVFILDPQTGRETVLHAFTGPSFSGNPSAGLVLAGDLMYGTTAHGGRDHCGGGCGTVFSVNIRTGKEKDVYRFRSKADGYDPEGGLVVDQGVLYGTTISGGKHNGTVWSLDLTSGAKTTLHQFKFTDGAAPGTLMSYAGALYGTTHDGGASGQGAVFRYRP